MDRKSLLKSLEFDVWGLLLLQKTDLIIMNKLLWK